MTINVWILDDGRPGTTNQAIALAKELGFGYELKIIHYNIFASLPNIFFLFRPFHVKKNILDNLFLETQPNLIIAAGRRAASVSAYLKEKFKANIKIIQIMRHNLLNTKQFDLIVLPRHDRHFNIASNIVKITGALCQLDTAADPKLFYTHYPSLQESNREFIGVLIGGSSKNYNFSLQEAECLVKLLNNVNSQRLPLFITFSRRTPEIVKHYISSNFPAPNIIYETKADDYNPYKDILRNAKMLVTTADSISICSEVAFTGKPLYIYCSDNLHSKKHQIFIDELLERGICRKLDDRTKEIIIYHYTPLQEVKKVVAIIKEKLL